MEPNVYRAILEERIADLWKRREWYRTHLGWIVQQHVEDRHELRSLVHLARRARRAERVAQEHQERESRRLSIAWGTEMLDDSSTTLRGWAPGEITEAFGR